jgi:hypothetical protein
MTVQMPCRQFLAHSLPATVFPDACASKAAMGVPNDDRADELVDGVVVGEHADGVAFDSAGRW